MKDLHRAVRQLYLQAFEGEDPAFLDRLMAIGFPHHLMAIGDHGKLVSMLFALPYPIVTEHGVIEARYLYAVATDKAYRGKGYAKRLLAEAAVGGTPVFLRPMSPSLFSFYESAGFSPFSPHRELCGDVQDCHRHLAGNIRILSISDYLTARDVLTPMPHCRPTARVLELAFYGGGAVGEDGRFAALYVKRGDTVLFKEWYGDRECIPYAAAFLGATHYQARFPDENGTPFGVGIGVPEGTVFLAAMD